MCIRCRYEQAHEPLGLCTICAAQTRTEVTDGMRRLSEYLAVWASFDAWLDHRSDTS